jgi:hypothetical protein
VRFFIATISNPKLIIMLHLARSRNTSLSRCLMAGLACGLLAGFLGAVYTYAYGQAASFTGGMWFSPLTFFVGIPILFVIAGYLLFEMVEFVSAGRGIFMVLIILLTALGVILSLRYKGDMAGLMVGLMVINGLLMSLLLPYFATHARIFMDREEYEDTEET